MSDIGAVQVVLLGFGHQNAGFAFVSVVEYLPKPRPRIHLHMLSYKIHLQGIICKDIFTRVILQNIFTQDILQGYINTGYLTKNILSQYIVLYCIDISSKIFNRCNFSCCGLEGNVEQCKTE